MLASFAEYERGTIRERTQAGLHRALRNGKFVGRLPYGYKLSPNETGLEVVEEEARVVREIFANIAAGATLYSESKRLNDEGIPSPGYRMRSEDRRRGTRSWSPSTVRLIVHQTAYSGVHKVRVEGRDGQEEIIERLVPAIVEPDLRERAEAQMVENKSRSGELRKNGRKYLLRGFIRCGVCDYACSGCTKSSRNKKYVYYSCISNRADRGWGTPPHRPPNIPAEWLEGVVWDDVQAFLENPGEVLERLRSEGIETDSSLDDLSTRHDDLTRRLAAKNAEKDRYVRTYAQGHISEEELADYMADIKNQIGNLKLLISSVEDDLAGLGESRLDAQSAEKWLLALREGVSEVESDTSEAFQKRRELVRLLLDGITIDRDENGDPRVEITYRFGPPPGELFVSSGQNSSGM
jgi:organic radical activating enzyme